MPMLPCIFCGEDVEVLDWSGENQVYYPPTKTSYAYHTRGCGADTDVLWARIDAITEAQRAPSKCP